MEFDWDAFNKQIVKGDAICSDVAKEIRAAVDAGLGKVEPEKRKPVMGSHWAPKDGPWKDQPHVLCTIGGKFHLFGIVDGKPWGMQVSSTPEGAFGMRGIGGFTEVTK